MHQFRLSMAPLVVALFVGAVDLSSPISARGQSFTEAWVSGSPAGWTFGLLGPSDPAGSGSATITTGVPGYLTMSAVGFEAGGAAAAFYLKTDTPFTGGNTNISSVLNPTNETLSRNVGVITNFSTSLFGPQAYIATITYGGSGSLDITRFSGGTPTNLAALSGASYGWTATASYVLDFTATAGGNLTAQIFNPAAPTIPIATLSVTDPNPFSPGVAGLIVQRDAPGQALKGTFGLSVATVPEPSSVMLAIGSLGLLGAGGWWRGRLARRAERQVS